MATKRTTKKTTKRPARKNAGLFGAAAVAKAKKVMPLQRVKEKETGQIGTVTGVKPGYLKVKWDGRTRQTLIRASAVTAVNPKAVQRKGAKPQSRKGKRNGGAVYTRDRSSVKVPPRTPASDKAQSAAYRRATTAINKLIAEQNKIRPLPSGGFSTSSIAAFEKLQKRIEAQRVVTDRAIIYAEQPLRNGSVPPAVAGGSKPAKKKRVVIRAKVIKKVVINKAQPGKDLARMTDAQLRAGLKDYDKLINRTAKTLSAANRANALKHWRFELANIKRELARRAKRNPVVINPPLKSLTDAQVVDRTLRAWGRARRLLEFSPAERRGITQEWNRMYREAARRKIAIQLNPAKNPAPRANSAAAKKFEAFQGRPATKTGSADVSSQAKGRGTMYPIGRLIKIKIRGVGEVNGAPGSFLLADTKDKLWISGKIGKARPGTTALDKVGEIEHVVYRAHKAHIVDGMQDYIHKLGEETGAKPMLYIDPQGFGVIRGGAYSISPAGIIN